MYEEQLTELQNSITAALVKKPLAVCTAAIDEAFDDAFGPGGRDSECRDLIDCYAPFYDEVGKWVHGYELLKIWRAEEEDRFRDRASISPEYTLFGWIHSRALNFIYESIDYVTRTAVELEGLELEPEQAAAFAAAYERLHKYYGCFSGWRGEDKIPQPLLLKAC